MTGLVAHLEATRDARLINDPEARQYHSTSNASGSGCIQCMKPHEAVQSCVKTMTAVTHLHSAHSMLSGSHYARQYGPARDQQLSARSSRYRASAYASIEVRDHTINEGPW
jgi:hypothetical protein